MRRITLAVAHQVERELEPHGLTSAQWLPLLKLFKGEARTAAELSRLLYLDAGSITRMLDRLEDKGFVQRTRSEQDRRVVQLELTPLGHATAAKIPEILREAQGAHLQGFSPAEVDTLQSLLRRMLDNAQARPVDTDSPSSHPT